MVSLSLVIVARVCWNPQETECLSMYARVFEVAFFASLLRRTFLGVWECVSVCVCVRVCSFLDLCESFYGFQVEPPQPLILLPSFSPLLPPFFLHLLCPGMFLGVCDSFLRACCPSYPLLHRCTGSFGLSAISFLHLTLQSISFFYT